MLETQTRLDRLEQCGRAYGELHLAVAFTKNLELDGDGYKRVYNWKDTRPLSDGDFGAAVLRRGENRNPAVCLRASGLIGVDIDGLEGRMLAYQLVPRWPTTVEVLSGRQFSAHLWFRAPYGTTKHKIQFTHSLQLSADGYFICPPALHLGAGTEYRFMEGKAPWDVPLATFPLELMRWLTNYAGQKDLESRADDYSPITEGDRHYHLLRLAGAMRYVGAGEPVIVAALLVENQRRCDPPKTDREVRKLARDIVQRYPPGERP